MFILNLDICDTFFNKEQAVEIGICTLDRKMTSFRQNKNIIAH